MSADAKSRIPFWPRVRGGAVRLINRMASGRGYEFVPVQHRRSMVRELAGVYSNAMFPGLLPADQRRLELLERLIGTTVSEALYVLAALRKAMEVEGDVCEFGVAQGATSALLANEIRMSDRTLWLFDTFKGLPAPGSQDQLKDDIFRLGSIEAYEGEMVHGATEVEERLAEIHFPPDRTRIVPGMIEDVVTSGAVLGLDRICFAYVDFDFYSGTRTALDFLDRSLPVGGRVVVDDYDFFSTGVKKAVDEFLTEHADDYVLSLPVPEAGHFCILERVAGAEEGRPPQTFGTSNSSS